jgi:hypothetical protein
MRGYELVTLDDDKVGNICEEDGDFLIVEHGIFNTKHAVPSTFVELDDVNKKARTTLSKQLIHSSPKVHDGGHDIRAIAEHYGLAQGFDDPLTRGYGDVLPDDPGRTAEEDAVRAGVDPISSRVRTREALASHEPDPPRYDSPGITGGDRYRDVPDEDATTK